MKVQPIKTHKITVRDTSINPILDRYLPRLKERSIVAVTSKIVAICEGRTVLKKSDEQKDILAVQEADYYLPRTYNQYGFMISVNKGVMVASAGIDESNGNGTYVLWPKSPQKSADAIRRHLIAKHKLTYLGVVITDSKLTPLRWGVTGVAIAHSGFRALNSYVGKPDIFGRKLRAEKTNAADALATAAVLTMGEGNEQQPLAVIDSVPFVQFQKRNPTQKEKDELRLTFEKDVYASLLTSVKWKKGGGGTI